MTNIPQTTPTLNGSPAGAAEPPHPPQINPAIAAVQRSLAATQDIPGVDFGSSDFFDHDSLASAGTNDSL